MILNSISVKFSLLSFFWLVVLLCSCQTSLNSDQNYQLLSETGEQYRHPTWSPDGNKIAYLTRSVEQIVIVNLDGTEIQRISINPEGISGPITLNWLNETEIVYSLSFQDEPGIRTSVLSSYNLLNDEEQTILSTDRIHGSCWSRVDQKFAFIMRDPSLASHAYGNTIQVADFPVKTPLQVYRSEGGREIVGIACNNNSLIAIVEKEGEIGNDTHRLLILDLETQTKRTVYEISEMRFESPTWSPDGKWIAVRTLQGQADAPLAGIMLISFDGTKSLDVIEPNLAVYPLEIEWSPVRDHLLIKSGGGFGKYSLLLFDLTPWTNS